MTDTLFWSRPRSARQAGTVPCRDRRKASNWLAKTWRSVRERTGFDIALRQFRSGYINVADDAGMTLDQIAGITGHASIRTVKRHYLVVEEKRAHDNANKVAERIQLFRSKAP